MRRSWLTSILVFLNFAVFFAWIVQGAEENSFLGRHFLVSWRALNEHRYWTLVTSVFSHIEFLHLFMNVIVLRSFGPIVEVSLGRWRFLRFYLVAGTLASLTHCVVSAYLMAEPGLPALGASGAISGLVLLFSLCFPRERILLFGLVPVPAIWGAVFFVGLDLWGLIQQTKGGGLPIGHGAHLGGAATGIIYYYMFVRGKLQPGVRRI